MPSRVRLLARAALPAGLPLALLLTAGAAQAGVWRTSMEQVQDIQPTGGSFTQELARGYKSFAASEAHVMGDWVDANYFATKALMANQGTTVAADRPDSRTLPPAHRPQLEAAYLALNDALDRGAWNRFPDLAAAAQVQYDCWLEQTEEGHQPDDIAGCRRGFELAMAKLDEAMRPPPAPQAAAPAPEPEAKPVPGPEIARETVYFEWDRSDIGPEAQAKIDAFAERMRPMRDIVLVVVGHADRSGSESYNDRLSARRAENVRAELMRQGLPVAELERIQVEAKGEREPAVATADGVREPANRRVEMTAHGMVDKMVRVYAVPKQTVGMLRQ